MHAGNGQNCSWNGPETISCNQACGYSRHVQFLAGRHFQAPQETSYSSDAKVHAEPCSQIEGLQGTNGLSRSKSSGQNGSGLLQRPACCLEYSQINRKQPGSLPNLIISTAGPKSSMTHGLTRAAGWFDMIRASHTFTKEHIDLVKLAMQQMEFRIRSCPLLHAPLMCLPVSCSRLCLRKDCSSFEPAMTRMGLPSI